MACVRTCELRLTDENRRHNMDPIQRIEAATAVCSEAVKGVKADQMGDQTPCAEFKEKEPLNDLLGGLEMLRTAATGGKATAPEGNVVGDNPSAQYDEGRT